MLTASASSLPPNDKQLLRLAGIDDTLDTSSAKAGDAVLSSLYVIPFAMLTKLSGELFGLSFCKLSLISLKSSKTCLSSNDSPSDPCNSLVWSLPASLSSSWSGSGLTLSSSPSPGDLDVFESFDEISFPSLSFLRIVRLYFALAFWNQTYVE